MIRLATRDPRVTAEQRFFDALEDLDAASLDGVWANFSLLHAPRADLPRYLGWIAESLKPGGVFVIAVKTGTGEERDDIGRRYTYFTEDELRARLAEAGLTPVRVDHGRDRGLSGRMDDWISLTCLR